MPPVSNFNKIKIITLVQHKMSYRQISAQLGIPSSTVFSIMKKWRQTETVERLPGFGGHLVSTPNDEEALLNIVQNSPFTDAVAAVNITNFPGSVWTARRRIKANNLRNYKAAKKIRLTPRHMEARIGLSLQHLVENDFWSRVIFSDEKVFQSSPNGQLRV
jgi:Mn-dependent DtxR family transcriptional regulator